MEQKKDSRQDKDKKVLSKEERMQDYLDWLKTNYPEDYQKGKGICMTPLLRHSE